ncbi:MAG TPA: hypothetical protein VGD78_20405 [Chthoniobacterales bacterium]
MIFIKKMHLASLVAVAVSFAPFLCAQEVMYDLTGTYATDQAQPATDLAAPGGLFDFHFLVPERVPITGSVNQPYYVNTPILSGTYQFGGITETTLSGSYQYAQSGYNRTSLLLHTAIATIDLEAFGQGPGNLPPLALPNADYSEALFRTGNLGQNDARYVAFSLAGGTQTAVSIGSPVTIVGTTVPEPATAAYLAVGFVALLGVTRICGRKPSGRRTDHWR